MPNKSSPNGGFITEGTVISATLRTQDLLRAFATELRRVLPTNGLSLAIDAEEIANVIDAEPEAQVAQMTASDILSELIDQLNSIAANEGFYFGAHPGDGSDFGYWTPDDDEGQWIERSPNGRKY